MSMQTTMIGFIVLVILAGGAYMFSLKMSGDVMMQEKNTMSAAESTQQGDIMEKGDAMEKDAMQKDAMTDTENDAMEQGAMKDIGDSVMKNEGAMMMHGGTYETFAPEKMAWANDGKVVLFFRASWCPTCRAVDADIQKNLSSIPGNVTILDVNYDTETALKQKYGVTYQHTFVQVDASGNQIAKWSGSPTLAMLLSNVK